MRMRGKSLICVGLGIGYRNFERVADRMIWRIFIAITQGVVVRQEGVAEALGLKNDSKLIEAVDIVFGVEVNDNETNTDIPGSVVFALAQIFQSTKDAECSKFSDGMGLIINDLINQGYTVHMVEFTKTLDRYLYDEVLKRVNAPEKIVYHEYTANPYEVVEIFGQARFSICMRFHSLVMSIISQTPCCIVSYSDKIDDVVSRLELEKYTVRISPISNLYYESTITFDIAQFQKALSSMVENEARIKSCFAAAIRELHLLSMKNWELLEHVIKKLQMNS